MEQDPSKINDADRQVESRIIEIGEAYAESNKRQKVENKKRAENRNKIKELGVRTDSYQVAVRICKDLTESERKDFLRDLELLVRVLGPRQADFFADEKIKAEKREQKRKDAEAAAARTPEQLNAASDANPKSDPKRGGAGKAKKPKDAVEKLNRAPLASETPSAADPATVEAEQAEGAAILDAVGKPKSQSAQVAAIQEKLGTNR